MVFQLGYTQHGGSGLGWSPETVMAMDYADIIFHLERLGEERKREEAAMRRATSSGRG